MKISYNWLKDYVDFDLAPEELAERLTLHGLEVDELQTVGSNFEGIVVGEVLSVDSHPNADKLTLCQVNQGDDVKQIICGAPNVAKGQKVPVAKVNAELPVTNEDGSPFKIKKAKIRGQRSEGMICAEDELGIGDDHSGIMVLDPDLEPGTLFSEIYGSTLDYIIDIELTPNRPDASSHIGVARDIAAFLGVPLKKPEVAIQDKAEELKDIDIEIKNADKCNRYVGLLIRDIEIKDSPSWLKTRLENIGVRPVNNVVDATNFVLHEMGQPLHAFDYDKLKGRKIEVQDFEEDVTFETLDHEKRTVPAGSLFICDAEEPIALAGVMGGTDSEISETTQNVLLESAWFDPATIRKTSKELGLQTDASYRFERGVDPNITLTGGMRCAELIAQLTGGKLVDGYKDEHPVKPEPQKLTLRRDYLNKILGTDFSLQDASSILERLEIQTSASNEDALACTVPSFRPDLQREVDLVEEVGRIYDYNNIATPSYFYYDEVPPIDEHESFINKVKSIAQELNFREIYTNSLLSEEAALNYAGEDELVHTLNPISRDMAVLRPNLLHGYLRSVAHNTNRNINHMRFFEIGHVFRKGTGTYFKGYDEGNSILFGIAGYKTAAHWLTGDEMYNVFDFKSPVMAFLKKLELSSQVKTELQDQHTLTFYIAGDYIGTLKRVGNELLEAYEIELPVFAAEFDLDVLEARYRQLAEHSFQPIPRFPSFEYDIAVIVDSQVPASRLLETIKEQAGPNLQSTKVFDVFEGESVGKGNKSIAFRMNFLDREQTLTINDVQPIIDSITKELASRFDAQLRSSQST